MNNFLKNLGLLPDKTDLKSLLISFILTNFCFLYHSLNFMWGNHDVEYMKHSLQLSSGFFEGRFSQFILPTLLTNGHILPIITNLLGLTFLILGLWLLAIYWKLPKSTLNYSIFITFFATLPYTLSWFYFTFITLSCLAWVFFAILGLYLSSLIKSASNKPILTLSSVFCFYLILGGYPPVINTVATCFIGKIILSYIIEEKDLKTIFSKYIYTVLNILLAIIAFKLTIICINPDKVYNLELTPLSDMPQKFISTIGYSFKQFILSQPFMEKGYKILLLTMVLVSFTGLLIKSTKNLKKYLIAALLIFTFIWATSLTTFLVIPPTQYISRIDFYGVAFVYAFALFLLLSFSSPLSKSLALIYMLILLPFNILNDYRALKVWQQGFDAEIKILDDIVARIEEHPAFNPQQKYRFYPAGDISLRPNYYTKKYEQYEPFLLTLPYLATWQSSNLLELYSPYEFINRQIPILPTDITQDVRQFILEQAQPYPHKNSIFINHDIIIVIYNQIGLTQLQEKIHALTP